MKQASVLIGVVLVGGISCSNRSRLSRDDQPILSKADNQIPLVQAQPSQRVYAHYMQVFPEAYTNPDHAIDQTGTWNSIIADAKNNGVDGFFVDDLLINDFRTIAVDAVQAASALGGFTIAPCLDTSASSDISAWKTRIEAWINWTNGQNGQMQRNGVPVIFIYNAAAISASNWSALKASLALDGYAVYLIGDVGTVSDASTLHSYGLALDALYVFNPANLNAVFGAESPNAPRIVTVEPGYFRSNLAAFSLKYKGSETYRQGWANALQAPFGGLNPSISQSRADWVAITTWNDYAENTLIEPSRNQSNLLGQLTRIGRSYLRKDLSDIADDPESLWLSAPPEMPDGPGVGPLEGDLSRESIFELTRINPNSKNSISVQVKISSAPGGQGSVYYSQSLNLGPDPTASAAQFSWQPTVPLGVSVIWASATYGAIETTQPIQIWPRNISRVFLKTPLRTKLIARALTPPDVYLSQMNENGCSSIGLATSCLEVSGILPTAPLRTDVTYNLATQTDPLHAGIAFTGIKQLPSQAPAPGFWNAAQISPSDFGVYWGSPQWIAFPTGSDLSLLASLTFNNSAIDASVYSRSGNVVTTNGASAYTVLKDGTFALESSTQVYAKPTPGIIPASGLAASTVEMWVYPRDLLGGMVFGDTAGALLMTLTASGSSLKLNLQRHTLVWSPLISSTTSFSPGQWTHLAAVFNAGQFQIFINGLLAGSGTVNGDTASGTMALGRNLATGGQIFSGMIKNFKIYGKALSAPDLALETANIPALP